jgi:hypothetical protein
MTKKLKSVLSASRVMLLPFWDFNRPIFEHYQNYGQMVNSAWCCAMLVEELKPVICSKHKGLLTNGVVLHHDSAFNVIWQQ